MKEFNKLGTRRKKKFRKLELVKTRTRWWVLVLLNSFSLLSLSCSLSWLTGSSFIKFFVSHEWSPGLDKPGFWLPDLSRPGLLSFDTKNFDCRVYRGLDSFHGLTRPLPGSLTAGLRQTAGLRGARGKLLAGTNWNTKITKCKAHPASWRPHTLVA
jgi:hypothetical protein